MKKTVTRFFRFEPIFKKVISIYIHVVWTWEGDRVPTRQDFHIALSFRRVTFG